MKPQDLDRFRVLAQPRIHPREDRGVFTVTRMNLEKDRYDTSLWEWRESRVREVPGTRDIRSPEWAPDGSAVAFMEKTPDDPDKTGDDAPRHMQLAVRDELDDASRVLTSYGLGVNGFHWAPEGDRILVIASEHTEAWAKLSADDRKKAPRRITALPWRNDNNTTYDDRRPVLALVDPTGQRKPVPLALPDDVVSVEDAAWHPDGARVAVLVQRVEPEKRTRFLDTVLEIEVDGGATRERHRDGGWNGLVYAGDRLVGHGLPAVYDWPAPVSLYEIPEDGKPVHLLPDLDRMVNLVRPAEDTLFFLHENEGRQVLASVDAEGTVRRYHEDRPFAADFDVRIDGSDPVVVHRTPVDPGELYLEIGGTLTELTSLNADFRAEVPLAEPIHFTVDTGGATVDTWVYLPGGEGKVPALLSVHGGPATQYPHAFFDEFQVYARAGYGVVACNPRGSSGRGADHLRAVRNDGWGTVDEQDVLACLDAALDRVDRLDRDRQGVMGGSYGGFMTAWLIGRHDRFRCAIVERGLVNWVTFNGISDIAEIFAHMYFDAGHDPELMWEKSPLRLAGKVSTPTLVLHSEQDWRCPIEQAEQYFTTLLRGGTTAEFLRFPGECHELSRSGDPKHRVTRFEAVLDWHARHLKG